MGNFVFKYGIRSCEKMNEKIDNLWFYIERKLVSNKENNLFYEKYVLVLVIRRELNDDDLTLLNKTPYLRISHSLNERICSCPSLTEMRNIDPKLITRTFDMQQKNTRGEFIYIKYELEDIDEEVINGYGVIEFLKTNDECESANSTNRYFYRIDFRKKIFIEYEIVKLKKKLSIRLIDVPKSVKCNLHFKIAFSADPTYKLEHFLESKIESTINKINRRKCNFIIPIKENELEKIKHITNFYLVIDDEIVENDGRNLKLSDFFILVNNSKNACKKTKKRKFTTIEDKGGIYCPYCLDEINPSVAASARKKHEKFFYCNRKNDKFKAEKNGIIYSHLVVCEKYSGDEEKNVPLVIPEEYFSKERLFKKKNKNINISLLGVPDSGKTVFLSRLLGIEDGKNPNLEYLNKVFSRFDIRFKLNNIQYISQNTSLKDSNIFHMDNVASQHYNTLDDLTNGNDIEKYSAFKFDNSKEKSNGYPAHTDTSNIFLPFILMSPQANIVISDISGENAQKNITSDAMKMQESRITKNSHAFIVIVSPNDENLGEIWVKIDAYIKHKKNSNIPIAVVLTKFDSIDKSSFDKNCFCLRDDTFTMSDGKYENSPLEDAINRSSGEIESYILEKNPGVLPEDYKQKYSNIKFFAISSIGEVSMNSNNNECDSRLLFYGTPYRIELPLIWIFYLTQIIA